MLSRTWSHRDLLVQLVKTQYKLRYRQSFAGFSWAVIGPLATIGAGTLVFHRVAHVGSGRVPYELFVMAGLVPWTFFANSVGQAVTAVSGAQQIVTRLPFPRATLPISLVGLAFLDLAVSAGLFGLLAAVTGTPVGLTALWALPFLALQIAFTIGMALLVSSLNMFARDLRQAVPLGIQLWLFVTPVMYPLSAVPRSLRPWFLVNPMTGFVETIRRALVYGQAPSLSLVLPTVIGTVAALALGWWYFAATESRFADVI